MEQIKNQTQLVEKDRRFGKGIVIALSRRIIKISKLIYRVESETVANKFYAVLFVEGGPTSCTCPDYENHCENNRYFMCKHKYAVMAALDYNTAIDETEKKEEITVKKSYKEDEYTV